MYLTCKFILPIYKLRTFSDHNCVSNDAFQGKKPATTWSWRAEVHTITGASSSPYFTFGFAHWEIKFTGSCTLMMEIKFTGSCMLENWLQTYMWSGEGWEVWMELELTPCDHAKVWGTSKRWQWPLTHIIIFLLVFSLSKYEDVLFYFLATLIELQRGVCIWC